MMPLLPVDPVNCARLGGAYELHRRRSTRTIDTLTDVVNPKLRATGRALSPTTLILAGLCFALPFVTVSCATPGGYGRAAAGGTVSYTGVDLAVGGQPDVTPADKLRPDSQQRDDRLPPQPTALILLVLIAAGTGAAIAMTETRARRATVALIGGVAATALLVNQALAQSEVTVNVGEQLALASPGADPHQYVNAGIGFVICLILLLGVTVANAIAWWWRRKPQLALVTAGADPPTVNLT
jgi:hypothetical protein